MQVINIHPQNPQINRIKRIVDIILSGGIIAYPTESGYALGCGLNNKNGLLQIINIRKLSKRHHFTLMLNNLTKISDFAILNNNNFRLLRRVLPGAYTFILPATKSVPNRLTHNKRKTIGVRISSSPIVQSILSTMAQPMMSISLRLEQDIYDTNDVIKAVGNKVDAVIDAGYCPSSPTTVIDLVNEPILIRQGLANSDFLVSN